MISGSIKREARDSFKNSGMESMDCDYVHIVKNASEDYSKKSAIIVHNPNLKTDISELSNNYSRERDHISRSFEETISSKMKISKQKEKLLISKALRHRFDEISNVALISINHVKSPLNGGWSLRSHLVLRALKGGRRGGGGFVGGGFYGSGGNNGGSIHSRSSHNTKKDNLIFGFTGTVLIIFAVIIIYFIVRPCRCKNQQESPQPQQLQEQHQ